MAPVATAWLSLGPQSIVRLIPTGLGVPVERDGGNRFGEFPDPWKEVISWSPMGPPTSQVPAVAGPALSPTGMEDTAPVPVVTEPEPQQTPEPDEKPFRRSVKQRTLLVAIGVTAALLVGSGSTLVTVLHHRRSDAGPKPSQSAVAAPTTTAPAPTIPTTTAPPAAAQSSQPPVVPAVEADSSSDDYPPSNIVDPSTVATASVASLPLYASPGAATPEAHMTNPTTLGAPLVLLVTAEQGSWIQAYIPVRPNETTAWFPAADVTLSLDPYHIEVSLSQRELWLYRDNAVIFSTPIAPGAPSSPTPTGSYFVAFIVKVSDYASDPDGDPYGPYAMGTSDFSNTYYSFEGGPGQIGIHGTNQPWVIGTYASHGCIRLPNSAITTVATQIPPGTPVEIAP